MRNDESVDKYIKTQNPLAVHAILTPVKAIRRKCLSCAENAAEVKRCEITDCALYELRMGKRPKGSKPLKAIRRECVDCMGENYNYVRECDITKCPLHQYRMGHRPNREEEDE